MAQTGKLENEDNKKLISSLMAHSIKMQTGYIKDPDKSFMVDDTQNIDELNEFIDYEKLVS